MYFASADEQRYVQRALLPEARRQPVSEELRGWNWHQPPLKPVYARPLGVYEIAGKYCPTGRDVFLRRVRNVQAAPNQGMREGRLLHEVVANLVVEAKRLVYLHGVDCVPHLERLLDRPLPDVPTLESGLWSAAERERMQDKMRVLRAFEVRRIVERVESTLVRHRYLGPDALAILALPVNVEVKLNGRYLGLSEHLSADAVAFPEMLVLDLKFGPKEDFHHLTTTGYALVLESLFEMPVDVGCIVYARFVDGRVLIERDFHLIGDELRQTFAEEREEKMRLVSEEFDPGLPAACPRVCPYLRICRPTEKTAATCATSSTPANLPVAASVGFLALG